MSGWLGYKYLMGQTMHSMDAVSHVDSISMHGDHDKDGGRTYTKEYAETGTRFHEEGNPIIIILNLHCSFKWKD